MILNILQCAVCANGQLQATEHALWCNACKAQFALREGVPDMTPPQSHDDVFKKEMHSFWGGGWTKRRGDDPSVASKDKLLLEIGAIRLLADLHESNQMREMNTLPVEGKRVLEIGCGAGNSSIMIALRGAHMVASDLTEGGVVTTQEKFRILGINGHVVQADAEHLPFKDQSFDVVYSSGVLHHTPDIERAVAHIYRVLKPGGEAVVMLYARWSFYYLISLFLVQGILLGNIFRHGWKNWLGNITEKGWHTDKKKLNPLTRVYSARQMRALFKDFTVIGFRKCGFNWADIFPGIYRIWKRQKFSLSDVKAIVPDSIERLMGRFGGFALTITVRKPD